MGHGVRGRSKKEVMHVCLQPIHIVIRRNQHNLVNRARIYMSIVLKDVETYLGMSP